MERTLFAALSFAATILFACLAIAGLLFAGLWLASLPAVVCALIAAACAYASQFAFTVYATQCDRDPDGYAAWGWGGFALQLVAVLVYLIGLRPLFAIL